MTNEPEPNTRAGEALKPCPFCGSEGKVIHRFSSFNTIPWVRVACQNPKCGAEGSLISKIGEMAGDCERYEAEAITAWNTRPLPQPSELVETPEAFNKKKERCLAYVEQHWKWGNLTRLGIVNQLVRDGFRQTWAIEQADRIAPAANQAVAHITQLEAQIAKLQADGDKLAGALEACRAEFFAPEPNCSWHISPPCGDCVDYASIREAGEFARQALTEWKDRA